MARPNEIAHDALAMVRYDEAPAVLVVADSERAGERGRAAVTSGGGRVLGVAAVEEAAERLDQQVSLDAIWLEIDEDVGELLDRLLDRLDVEASADRFGAIVSAPPELIDPIAARMRRGAIQHLCEPTERDRDEALSAAFHRQPARLHDVNRGTTPRLQQLSEEVGRIANMLAELSEDADAEPAGPGQPTISAATIRAIIRARRQRDQFFPGGLFADPAWDMLLDLMAARLERRKVAVSSLCIAAAVPPTTALRWIKNLTDDGLFTRVADPQDGRRVYVELTDRAAAGFEAYLRLVSRTGSSII